MNPSNLLFRVDTSTRRLSPSEGMRNKVNVIFASSNEEIHEDQVTGIRTPIHSTLESLDLSVKLSIDSNCSQTHLAYLLFGRLIHNFSSSGSGISATRISFTALLCEALATRIALETGKLGFAFLINLLLAFTEQRVSVGSSSLVQKLVFEGFIGGEELRKVARGKETCSICLEDLLFGGIPTRMPCSHVFHARCILEWFVRKTTCPICLEDLLCGRDEFN